MSLAPPVRTSAAGLLFVFACTGSITRPEFERFDPRFTPVAADYPDVPAVVLLDRGLLTFGNDTERKVPFVRLRRHRRVKILRSSGLSLARIEIPYDPGALVRGLIARAVQPDGRIVRADVDDQRTVKHSSGVRARRLQIPEVRVGTIIEYAYDVYRDDLRFIEPWRFQSRLPTVRSEYAAVVPDGFEVDLRFSEEGQFVERPPERFEVDGAVRYSWSLSNLAPRFAEAGMPNRGLLSPRAHVLFRSAKVMGRRIEGFTSWDDVAVWHLARFSNWADLADATIDRARRMAADSAPDERALRLMEFVAGELAVIEPRSPVWRSSATHPDAVLRNGRGSETSRGMLLVALLQATGVSAAPALFAYGDRDVLLPDATTVRALDGVAAVIMRPGGPMVLDPNQLTVSTDVPSPRLQGTRIVVVRDDGAEITRVPISKASASRTDIEFALRLDPRGDIFGTVELRLTGAEAGHLRQRLLDATPEDYAARVSAFLQGRGAALPVESVTIADLRALRRPLVIKGRVTMRKAVPHDDTMLFVRIGQLIGGPTEPIRQTRRSPLLLGPPRSASIRGTLALPEGYEVDEVPPNRGHDFDGVRVAFEVRAETRRRIGFARKETWNRSSVSPQKYRAYYRFIRAMRETEDQAFSIRRPAERPLEY